MCSARFLQTLVCLLASMDPIIWLFFRASSERLFAQHNTRCLLFDESRLVSLALVPIFSLCCIRLLVSFGSVVYAQ
jgi:hypothetical protein